MKLFLSILLVILLSACQTIENKSEAIGKKENYRVPQHNCCDIPNVVFESGCETCKSCGYSVCLIA